MVCNTRPLCVCAAAPEQADTMPGYGTTSMGAAGGLSPAPQDPWQLSAGQWWLESMPEPAWAMGSIIEGVGYVWVGGCGCFGRRMGFSAESGLTSRYGLPSRAWPCCHCNDNNDTGSHTTQVRTRQIVGACMGPHQGSKALWSCNLQAPPRSLAVSRPAQHLQQPVLPPPAAVHGWASALRCTQICPCLRMLLLLLLVLWRLCTE